MIRVGERLETLAQSGSIFTNGLGLLYNLHNQEQEFFVEFIDHKKSTGYLFFIP
jgi:hypothetical protein